MTTIILNHGYRAITNKQLTALESTFLNNI